MEEQNFKYTYSAKEQAELKKIRSKYLTEPLTPRLDKMAQIRKIDNAVTKTATAWGLCMGLFGTLALGTGMSLIMTDLAKLGAALSPLVWGLGIAVGVLGIAGIISAFPLYQFILRKKRAKHAPEILRLTEDLLQG